jgi:hypothetical protein
VSRLPATMCLLIATLVAAAGVAPLVAQAPAGADGFTSLFNGKDLTGWKVPAGDNGHWKVVDGVIDYDAQSEAAGEKGLPTEREFGDYVLRLEWRIKETPYINDQVRIIMPDGSHKKGPDGKDVLISVPDSDSGVYMRGFGKAQVNIWCWPVGSGEVYGYRMDEKMPPAVRAAVTPRVLADRNVGEWNAFEITMRGDRGVERQDGDREGATPRRPRPGSDHAATPRRQEGRSVGQPAQPRAVPQHQHQAFELTLEAQKRRSDSPGLLRCCAAALRAFGRLRMLLYSVAT